MDPTLSSWISKISAAIKSDPKKTGVLSVLSVVLLVVVGRPVLTGRTNPAPARAGAAGLSASTDLLRSTALIKNPSRREGSLGSMQEWLTSRKKPASERNLFAVRLEYFPRDVKTPTASTVQGRGFWEGIAKSLPSPADQKKERQILIENLQLKAAELKLQTTVTGAEPKALVNGELVREGDVVASGSGENRTPFRVLKIESRRIIVEREGIRLAIPMK